MAIERERLRDLSRRVLRLHKVLLDRERRGYEARHGRIAPGTLFRLLLHDEQFVWLRSLSGMIAEIDALVDGEEEIADDDVQRVFREVYRLLKSGSSGTFHEKYVAALQDSPEVVMAHAEVSRVLGRDRA